MAAGAGYYFGAAATTVIVVVVLYLLREVRNALLAPFRTEFGVMTVAFSDAGSSMSDVTETLERQGVDIRSLSAEVEGATHATPSRSASRRGAACTRHLRRYPRFRTSSR
jgi:putative Mg2+ transporter-C (MgtC) family protein